MFSLHIDTARTWRGGQGQVRYTVLGLRAIGQRAALVAHPEGELFRRMQEGLDLVPLEAHGEIDLNAAWQLSRVLRQLTPDIIHAHDPQAVAMAVTARAIWAPSPRPPVVASHRIELRVGHSSFSRWNRDEVDCFIANSEAIRERLVAEGISRLKTVVVHEGVDVEALARMPAANVHAALYLPTHAPVVGNVAALVPHKGQHDLIEAAAIVVRAVPDARFAILGDGELRESLERQIREHHLERHVFLAGFRDDAPAMTRDFDVFVMSSIHEGMCTALVDAMAASRPAVATAVGGLPEVVADGETGFLVPPRDPEALASRIIELLTDDALRARMGAAALKRARAQFSVAQMVKATAAVYARLLEGRRPRS
jgi:glycosyltransferase involved in cell wall biosynthesis